VEKNRETGQPLWTNCAVPGSGNVLPAFSTIFQQRYAQAKLRTVAPIVFLQQFVVSVQKGITGAQ
jgi:hypothetical protein